MANSTRKPVSGTKTQPKTNMNVGKSFNRVTAPVFAPATKRPAASPQPADPAGSRVGAALRPQAGPGSLRGPTPTPVAGQPARTGGATSPAGIGHAGTATAPAKTPTVLTAVPTGHSPATPQVNNIRFLDPNFARSISNLRPAIAGVPRDQIKVPICPSANVTDEVLFEDPAQPAKKFYLPRYKLVMKGQRYEVAFRQDDTGWSFAVSLSKFPAPSVAAAAPTAQEIDHHVAVLVRFNQMIGNQPGGQEELSFQEVTLKSGVLQATLRLNSVQQRDLLFQALRDRTFATALIVRRAITVGVPVPQIPVRSIQGTSVPPQPGRVPTPPKPAPPMYRQADRAVDQVAEPKPFVFSPELHKYIFSGITPASDENLALTRYQVSWSDGRSHTYYQDAARPSLFYYLPDSFKIARRPDGAHEPLISIRFGQASSKGDLKATFSFIAVPYLDPGRLRSAADQLKASLSEPLPKGQDQLQFEPLLSAPDKAHFSLSYPGCDTSKGPFELREKAMVDLRSGIHDSLSLSLEQFQSLYDALFSPSSLLLTGKVDVELGSDSGEEIPFAARLNDLAGDFLGYAEQPLTDDGSPATAGGASDDSSLQESVTAAVGDALSGDVKDAVADIAGGLVGKLLHHGKKDKEAKPKKSVPTGPSPQSERGVQATLQNIIESPVEIQALAATLVRGTERLAAAINGLDLSQPVQISPGGQTSFAVTPSVPTKASQPVHVEYDLSRVHVIPDKDAIWKEILDPNTADSYLTTITVKTPASTFVAPADDSSRQVASVVVDFDSGVSAELNASKLEVKVDLPHPVVNFVLRKADPGEYRYKLTIVRANGQQTRDSDWRPPETTTVLFPEVR